MKLPSFTDASILIPYSDGTTHTYVTSKRLKKETFVIQRESRITQQLEFQCFWETFEYF